MERMSLIALCLLSMAACGRSAAPPDSETKQIVSAVLAAQPDLAAVRKAFLAKHPEEEGLLEALADARLCVARETAGTDNDFDRTEMIRPGAPPFDHAILSKRWDASDLRVAIDDVVILPEHLRWSRPLTWCPSGTLRLGNPTIEGDRARVFVENKCSGWCGWAGEARLRRKKGSWFVEEEVNWWQA